MVVEDVQWFFRGFSGAFLGLFRGYSEVVVPRATQRWDRTSESVSPPVSKREYLNYWRELT